LTFTSQQ